MSGSVYKMVCPDCGGPLRVRNSVGQHPLFRNVFFQCMDINCGGGYGANMEITRIMSPSAKPNPNIKLPMADSALRRIAVKNEQDKQMDIDDMLNEGVSA